MATSEVDPAGLRLRARARRDEAHQVLEELRLLERWSTYGEPVVVGSVALDVVVRRDIDLEILCDQPSIADGFALMSALAVLPGVRGIRYRDSRDERGQGLYWKLDYEPAADRPWTVDMWVWPPGSPKDHHHRDQGRAAARRPRHHPGHQRSGYRPRRAGIRALAVSSSPQSWRRHVRRIPCLAWRSRRLGAHDLAARRLGVTGALRGRRHRALLAIRRHLRHVGRRPLRPRRRCRHLVAAPARGGSARTRGGRTWCSQVHVPPR